jgi:RNA polymerase sigma factor (sigma-70 family)
MAISGVLSFADRSHPDSSPATVTQDFPLLDRLAAETRQGFVGMARRMMGRLHLDQNGLSPEEAYQAAWDILCRRIQQGKIQPILTRETFEPIFATLVHHVLSDERRRQRARKRRGGVVHLSALEGGGFDAIDERSPGPDERASADEQARWLLHLLRRHDKSLRAIAVMKGKGYTHERIASILRVSTATVERRLAMIRSILEPYSGRRRG